MTEHVCDPEHPDCAAYLHYADPANREPVGPGRFKNDPRYLRLLELRRLAALKPEPTEPYVETPEERAERNAMMASMQRPQLEVMNEITRRAEENTAYDETDVTPGEARQMWEDADEDSGRG